MTLTLEEWRIFYCERSGAATCNHPEDNIEAQGLQPHLLSAEYKIVALALLRTKARAQAETDQSAHMT